jgi:Flp pilus assembly protein CpaB
MRLRTFILIILIFLVLGLLAVVFVVASSSGALGGLLGGGGAAPGVVDTGTDTGGFVPAEPGLPPPSPTPSYENVVVARLAIPIGEMLTEELLTTELRPSTNVALQGNYTFTSPESLVGSIVVVPIARGQEILQPMIALNPTDVSNIGSDLSLYVPEGNIAIAFPVDRFSGVSLAMRAGDSVDVIMTLRTVEIDSQFNSSLPNFVSRVSQSQLEAGNDFLFPAVLEGRLEYIPEINQVAAIVPSLNETTMVPGQTYEPGVAIPKRVTQLTIQQAKVIYVGQWRDPRVLEAEQAAAQEQAGSSVQFDENGQPIPQPTPTPFPSRQENPEVVILSMPVQEALALKFARDRDVKIDLVLRSPGDVTSFVTTSVSLPQIVDQGGLALPVPAEFDLFNPLYDPRAPYNFETLGLEELSESEGTGE